MNFINIFLKGAKSWAISSNLGILQTADIDGDQNMSINEEESSIRLGNLDW